MPAIAYQYDELTREVLDSLDRFVQREVIARHDAHEQLLSDGRQTYDDQGRYRPEVLQLIKEVKVASAQAGFYTLCVPEELGGSGMGMTTYFAVWERLFHLCGAKYWLGHFVGSHWSKGPSRVLARISDKMREEAYPDILSGKKSICFALSEPGAGSDAMNIKTRAEPDGDGWRLSGSKIWITNSPYADYILVFAVTDPELAAARRGGISLFMFPTSDPGLKIERVIRMWGAAGGDEAILHFDNIKLDKTNLVGDLHQGFKIAMLGVGLGRLYNCARAVGIARWATETAVEYAKVRRTFGKPISEYQGVMFPLADAAMDVHAAHLMSLNVAQLMDQGHPVKKELAMAKAFSTRAGASAVDRAIQTHGAMGFTNEMHLTEAYVTLRKNQVSDGTNEILRRAIIKQLLEDDVEL